MEEDQPRDPSNNHENQSGSINPLEVAIVLVDGISSNARPINEAIGPGKELRIFVEVWIPSKERIRVIHAAEIGIVVVTVGDEILCEPPRRAHGSKIEQSRKISKYQC
jgi:hypothetical protein